jgi:hypothetical protein
MRRLRRTDRRTFLLGFGASVLGGCASHGTMSVLPQMRGTSCNIYLSKGRQAESTRATQCISGSAGDNGIPFTPEQQQYFDAVNIDRDANGNPFVKRYNAAGGYTSYPVTGGVAVYSLATMDSGTATSLLASFQSYLNGIDYSGCDPDGAAIISADIATANSAIQTAYSTVAAADLANVADAVGRVRNDLPWIGGTHSKASTNTYVIFDWWNIYHPNYADRDAMQKPDRSDRCKTQQSTMRRIAAAMIDMNGMSTLNAPGAGVDSCAWAVEHALYNVLGRYIVGGQGRTNYVPDVTKGLKNEGWISFDDPSQARAGDVAVQNGRGDGDTGPYENHIGIVVSDPNDGKLAIMNNSSGQKAVVNFDKSMAFTGYYDPPKDGPPRFYRVPADGIDNQPICIGP